MRRTEQTYYTGRESDGSDRVEHRRVQWSETFLGREYVVQEQVDPAVVDSLDGAVTQYAPAPTTAAALVTAAQKDPALALLVAIARKLGV